MRPKSAFPRGLFAAAGVVALATVALAQNFPWPPQPKASPAASAPAGEAREQRDFVPAPPVAGAPAAALGLGAGPVATVAPTAPPARSPTDWRILENPNGPHTALFFDPVRQVFAVYHVDSGSGQIMLKSIRNLSADLRLDQFNSSNPAPKDIEAMLEEAR